MTQGELEKAKRRALRLLDEWNDVTGVLGGGYLYEVEGLIEDAVEIGVQHALGDFRPLPSEKPSR